MFFRQIDSNKNGYIEYEEFRRGFKIYNGDIIKVDLTTKAEI